ncbi:MAG: hypothetical protein R6X16_14945 [Anaerolineae bacterium]
MDDHLQRLRRWATHASMPRLYTELALRLAGDGYELEFEGEALTVYARRKAPGLRGWLGRSLRQPVMQLVRQDGTVTVTEEQADPEFVTLLLARLRT